MAATMVLENSSFSQLTNDEMMSVEGGLLPLAIPAGVILAGKIAAGVAAVGVVAAGIYVGYKQTTKDLETKYGK